VGDSFAPGEAGSGAEARGVTDGLDSQATAVPVAALGFGVAAGALILLGCVAAFACCWSRRGGGHKSTFKSGLRLTVRQAVSVDSSRASDLSLPQTPTVLERGRSTSLIASICAAPYAAPPTMNKKESRHMIRRTSERLSGREEDSPGHDTSHDSGLEEHSLALSALDRQGVGGSLSSNSSGRGSLMSARI